MRVHRLSLLLLALAAAGCTTVHTDRWSYQEPLPVNQTELFQTFGLPDAIRREQGSPNRWLRYDYSQIRGMTFGARYLALALILGRQHRAFDRLWVHVTTDGRVLEWQPGRSTPQLRYRLWPFGD